MMLSEEIRSVVASLHGQILNGDLTIETATLVWDILRDVADRVEMIRRVSGIDTVFFLPFTRETMRMPWREKRWWPSPTQ